MYLSRKAEARILREDKKIQQFLMRVSSGMTTIRDLKRLLGLIIHLVTKALKARNAAIYLFDAESNQYILKAGRFKLVNVSSLSNDDSLIKHLKENKSPLVYEEIKVDADKEDNEIVKDTVARMKELSACIILPTVVQDNLLGFLILGERDSSHMYTPDLINALSVLSNQAALAIENARFYENEKKNQALLFQSATLADLGVMADSMGHQIKNHLQKMIGLAGVEKGILEEYLQHDIPPDKTKELLNRYIESFTWIEEQGKVGKGVIESISRYSRLPKEAFKETTITDLLDAANDILKFKIKFDHFDYVVDIPDDLPGIYAHPILSEAFINLIDNAYDAIKEREERLNEPDYRGKIMFQARHSNSEHIEIRVSDNGIGIKKQDIPHLFVPFYTTKATANKGTGLGLFVLNKMIDNHKGKITVESEHLKGTSFIIVLPIRPDIQK